MGIRYRTFETPQTVQVRISPIAMRAIQWMLDCGYDKDSPEVHDRVAHETVAHWVRLWTHWPPDLPSPQDPEARTWLAPWELQLFDGTADDWKVFEIVLRPQVMNVIHQHAYEYGVPDWVLISVIANARGSFLIKSQERSYRMMGAIPDSSP